MNEGLRKLHTYESVQNVISGKELNELILKTFKEIFNTLSAHCGAYASNALLIIEDGLGNFNPTIFTKDGINILDNINYVSPAQTYLKNHMGYIGSRVDNAAHDGTTTSIMLASKIIERIFDVITNEEQEMSSRERIAFVNLFQTTLHDIRKSLKDHVFTLDDMRKWMDCDAATAQGHLAYIQTMITSKGNVALAEAMKEIYENTPEELHSYFAYKISPKEVTDTFEVEYPDGDFTLRVIPATTARFNHALGTEYLHENCDLIVLTEDLIGGYAEVDVLMNHLKETKTPTVVVTRGVDKQMVHALHNCNTETDVIICHYAAGAQYAATPIELMVLNAVANTVPVSNAKEGDEWIIRDVKCHIDRGILKINNIYELLEGENVHPFYKNPEMNPRYTVLVEEIQAHLDKLQNAHQSDNHKEIMVYTQALKDLCGGRLPILKIGGQTMDIRANESVVKDVLGAVTSVLEDGFVIDGNMLLYRITSHISKELTAAGIVMESMVDILAAVHDYDRQKMAELCIYGLHLDADDPTYLHTRHVNPESTNYDQFFQEFSPEDTNLVIQPYILYDELFKRLIEVVPKLVNTSKIVVPGTANVVDEGNK